jgi:hypothetical protein
MNAIAFAGQWEDTAKSKGGQGESPVSLFFRVPSNAVPVTGNLSLNIEPYQTTYLRLITELGKTGVILRSPVVVNVSKEREGFTAENEDLSIFVGGRTEDEALDEFKSLLIASWEGLKDESKESLTGDAQLLRERLSQHFIAA